MARRAPRGPPRPSGGGTGGLLPHARLHDLRHVHATTSLLAGVPVHVVAARLGHADPSVTLRVYAHVIRDQVAEAADIFARSIPAGDSPVVKIRLVQIRPSLSIRAAGTLRGDLAVPALSVLVQIRC